jgi:hypothetical protein
MKSKIAIMIICFVALIAWTGLAFAQTSKPTAMKTVKLLSGEEVIDLTGEWDTQIENYGEWAKFGSYTTLVKISLEGSSFLGTRLKDAGLNKAGTLMLLCGLGKRISPVLADTVSGCARKRIETVGVHVQLVGMIVCGANRRKKLRNARDYREMG